MWHVAGLSQLIPCAVVRIIRGGVLLVAASIMMSPAKATGCGSPPPSKLQPPNPQAGCACGRQPENQEILLARETRPDRLPPLSLTRYSARRRRSGRRCKLATADNNTTGRFMKQEFVLDVVEGAGDELIAEVQKRVNDGIGFIVTDASAPTLLKLADALDGQGRGHL